jgi:hypothetical protein
VSRHFREIAASLLYRNFRIVFPREDEVYFGDTRDSLAGGLDTFTTSEYNYCKHLRELSLDTLTAGDKVQDAYKAYQHSLSCGKFMNTLLLLTLRRSTALETFQYFVPCP